MATENQAFTIGKRLVELCTQGNAAQAVDELYADDAKHIEAAACGPDMPRVTEGKAKIRESSAKWETSMEVHEEKTTGPYPHGDDRFAVWMWADVTPSDGPMAGQRHQIEEVCLYTIKGGKISQVEFFYDMTAAMAAEGVGD